MGFNMGHEQDGMGDGMPDFGPEKGMKDVFDSLFQKPKPRRENDPKRKVGRDSLYGRDYGPHSGDGFDKRY